MQQAKNLTKVCVAFIKSFLCPMWLIWALPVWLSLRPAVSAVGQRNGHLGLYGGHHEVSVSREDEGNNPLVFDVNPLKIFLDMVPSPPVDKVSTRSIKMLSRTGCGNGPKLTREGSPYEIAL